MKKLLSILATVGLASTAGATVVACAQKPDSKATTRDAKAPALYKFWLSKGYGEGSVPLDNEDTKKLTSEIEGALKVANEDANINADTFTVTSKDIKTDTKSLEVKVKKTEPKEDKIGLNESTLTVDIEINQPTQRVEAEGTDVKVEVPNSKQGEILVKEDQEKLEAAIVKELKLANKDVHWEEDTFFANVKDVKATNESIVVWASNKETNSVGETPGLIGGIATIEVNVELTGFQIMSKNANPAIVDLKLLTTIGQNELITQDDKELLKEEIIKALVLANPGAVIKEDTFEVNLPENMMNNAKILMVNVHATESTATEHGLNEGKVLVSLALHSKWTKVSARSVDVNFELSETHVGEKLSDNDKSALQAQILTQLKEANSETVILDDTFGFAALDKLIVTNWEKPIDVTVQATESSYEAHGLTSDPVRVNLNLAPAMQDKVKASLPKEAVQVNLKETLKNQDLTSNDKVLVADAVVEALRKANVHAVVEDTTFTVNPETNINASDVKIDVLVAGTESSVGKSGLEEEQISVPIVLKEIKSKVNPREGTQADFKLESTLIGNKLSDGDKVNLKAKILEQLKEDNTGVNIQDDTFDFNLDEFVVESEEAIIDVHVNATDPTNDLQGFNEGNVKVKVNFTLFIDNLSELVSDDFDLGYILDNEPETILQALITKLPSAENEIIIESFTETSATIIAANPKKYQGKVNVKFNVKKNINDLLKDKTNLGYVDTPEEAKTKAGTLIKDEGLENKVSVGEAVDGKIIVTATDESLQGTATLTYQLTQDINDLLQEETILPFYVNKDVAANAVQKLVAGIPSLNEKVTVAPSETANEIIVTAAHESLTGAPFKFTFEVSTDLGQLLPEEVLSLGEFANDDEALTKANSLLVELGLTDQVLVEKVDGQNQIKVTPGEGSTLTGEAIFNYTIKA